MALFWAHRVLGTKVPTYFIESNAPDNVEDPATAPYRNIPDRLELIKAHKAVEEIAEHLAKASRPNLVFMVHGFANPQQVVIPVYAAASDAIERDPEIVCDHENLVCVGYRWPSESIGRGGAPARPRRRRDQPQNGAGERATGKPASARPSLAR